MAVIKKIAITGPESTGKSMLAAYLADHYNTVLIPEFARIYLARIGRPYDYDDILEIARGQVRSVEIMAPLANRFLFCDTELLVTKIWCDVKFGKCHPWIEQELRKQDFDLYLLTNIDLPWEFDPLREHPDKRELLFDLYRKALHDLGFRYSIVEGTGEQRYRNAISLVEKIK